MFSRLTAARIAVVLAVGLLGSGDQLAQAGAQVSGAQRAQIESAIASFKARQHIPSMSVAIVEAGEIRFQGAYGISDLENGVTAKPQTAYRIASTSKAISAVAALQLAEAGTLDLDAPVQKYAPGFPAKPFPITTRQVLAHLSGIRHYKGEPESTVRYENLTDALSMFKDDALEQEPGTRFTYTTYGYTLLGVIIEGASGLKFGEYLREHIFKPAGMRHSGLDDVYAIVPNRARGYTPRTYAVFNGDYRNARLMDSSYKAPGGGMLSTAEDLARFAIAVQDGVLLKPETMRAMFTGQRTRDGIETGYGYGWFIDNREGRQADGSVWHPGVQAGFTSDLWMLPQKRFAVVILANLEGGGRLGLATLANEIAGIVLR